MDPLDYPDVYFEANKPQSQADFDAETSRTLLWVAHILKRYEHEHIFVAGYADTGEGPENEALAISERRAQVVYDWLLAHGVNSTQLVGRKGFGTSQPVDFTDTEAQRRRNRRVEFKAQ